MNFKKRIQEEETTEKIRDKRNIRIKEEPKLENRKKDSMKFEEGSPKNDKFDQFQKHSPHHNSKNKKEIDSRSPGNDEKKFSVFEKGEGKRKTQIQTMNVNMMGNKILEEETSPKYHQGNRVLKKSGSPQEESDNSSNSGGGNRKKSKKDLNLQNKKSRSSHYIQSRREGGKENQKESVEEEEYSIYNETNNNGEELSMEEERDFEDERTYEKINKNNDNKKNPMFKPGGDKQGKLITTNVTSYKAIDGKSPQSYHSMQKMNKLSTILMSKSQEPGTRNDAYQTMDKKQESKLLKGIIEKSKGGKGKFISITMAMISSKGV